MKTQITELVEKLDALDTASSAVKECPHQIEIRKSSGGISIQANQEGLVWIALQALNLATQHSGSHIHLDESGMADRADIDLVIAKMESHDS